MPRSLKVIGLLALAALIALLGRHVIHNDLGVPNGTIRTDAFAAASVLGMLCAFGFMNRKG